MTKTTFFKKYTGKSESIVDALAAVGCKDTSKAYRTKIAKLNGIQGYTGLASQNKTMLTMLKAGKLIKSITKVYPMREKFIGRLQEYNPVIKKYGDQIIYSFDDSEPTFAEAKKKLKAGKKTGMTCVVPCRWAFKDIGINPSGFYAEDGTFKNCYKGDVKKHLERITDGEQIGKTVKNAVNDGLLKPGDIIAYKGKTHTFVYSGDKSKVYDGGRYGSHTKDGILFDYGSRKEKISEILRWID